MYIKKLQGTFGCLENKTLTFSPGLNVITAPNGSGKSTWCAFIRAMFFGISSREKSRAGFLPDKEKYVPWSGGAMYGRMELEKSGEAYIIERTSRNGVLSSARALNLTTGEETDAGEELVGVPKSVYERTAFISQAGIGIDGDFETERLILSAASSGEEGVSADEVISRIEKRKRAIRSPRGLGLLPEIEEEIKKISEAMYPEKLVPVRERLLETEAESAKADNELSSARLELRDAERVIESFPAFEGMSDALAESVSARDIERLENIGGPLPYIPFIFLAISVILGLLAATVGVFFAFAGMVALLTFIVALSVVFIKRRHEKSKLCRELFSRYGSDTAEGILHTLKAYKAAFARLESVEEKVAQLRAVAKQKKSELDTKRAEWNIVIASSHKETEEKLAQLYKNRDKLILAFEACELAEKTMREAQTVLQSRFSPALEERTSELFSELAGGCFEKVNIRSSDFEMDVSEKSGSTPRNILTLSRGMLDELYLALRLALCELILPQKDAPPIILDDALVNFDDERAKNALLLLREIAKTRQVILFSCHSREERLLSEISAEG